MEPQNPQDENRPQPQVIKPESMFNPSVPPQNPSTISPTPSNPQVPPPSFSSNNQRKKILIVLGSIVAVLALISIVGFILTSGNGGNGNDQNQQTTEGVGIIKEPSAIDIENANNSISSDISGLNDDNDFPQDNLSDDNLGL